MEQIFADVKIRHSSLILKEVLLIFFSKPQDGGEGSNVYRSIFIYIGHLFNQQLKHNNRVIYNNILYNQISRGYARQSRGVIQS